MNLQSLRPRCRHFRGDIPCKPHKEHQVHCTDESGNECSYFSPISNRILIIKLGALGDVLRTTPLLTKLRTIDPASEIWWITHSPDMLPKEVDIILPFDLRSLQLLSAVEFDIIYNLDKDREACALISNISAKKKRGFTLQDGKCWPIDGLAENKYLTGIFDDLSRANKKSYQEEVFEICGLKFEGEEYVLPSTAQHQWKPPKKKIIIGLNTGCGGRWTSRLWPDQYWIALAKKLKRSGYVPLLLGGAQEHKKNLRLSKQSAALYFGPFPLSEFIDLVDQCHLVVTAVTMAMHLAVGLKKRVVLFNNIFNKNEFELYDRGEIVEPDIECDCFYSPTCPKNCMQHLSVQTVFDACVRQVNHLIDMKK